MRDMIVPFDAPQCGDTVDFDGSAYRISAVDVSLDRVTHPDRNGDPWKAWESYPRATITAELCLSTAPRIVPFGVTTDRVDSLMRAAEQLPVAMLQSIALRKIRARIRERNVKGT